MSTRAAVVVAAVLGGLSVVTILNGLYALGIVFYVAWLAWVIGHGIG